MNRPLARRRSRPTAPLIAALLALVAAGFAAAQDMPHGDLDLDCTLCHHTVSWSVPAVPPDFDHATVGFPLAGGHEGVACRACHDNLVFAHVGVACADCHADVHRGELGLDCEGCHRVGEWENRAAMIDRHATLAFPLLGAHAWVDCGACHRGQPGTEYTAVPAECIACHEVDYQAAADPDHAAAGFPATCQDCHPVFATTWNLSTFQHGAAFPLRDAHARILCTDCHTSGYGPLPTDCYACHEADYQAAADPDHAAAGLPTDCRICHDEVAWTPASYRHDLTGFPLTGAHARLQCVDCHAGGYAGTPTDCYACHQLDYDATTDPSHLAAGFPITCLACHDTAAWEPAVWDHDVLFPIYSGRHREEWNECADCHVQPADYGVFECIFCHEHNQQDTDDDHDEVADYVYASNACFDCHPRGSE